MKFKLQFSSPIKMVGYKFAHFWNFAFLFSIPFGLGCVVLYFSIVLAIMEIEKTNANLQIWEKLGNETEKDLLIFLAIIAIILELFMIYKTSIYYVKITPKGVYLHHGNFVHYGLHQFPTINTTIPFKNILSCKIGIPVNCPRNFRYTYYNQFYMIKRYIDLKRGREVEYMKEPAIPGGRYDKECILLELDNKRIIVIPIDECEEFLELFNKYIEKYKELQKEKEKEI